MIKHLICQSRASKKVVLHFERDFHDVTIEYYMRNLSYHNQIHYDQLCRIIFMTVDNKLDLLVVSIPINNCVDLQPH